MLTATHGSHTISGDFSFVGMTADSGGKKGSWPSLPIQIQNKTTPRFRQNQYKALLLQSRMTCSWGGALRVHTLLRDETSGFASPPRAVPDNDIALPFKTVYTTGAEALLNVIQKTTYAEKMLKEAPHLDLLCLAREELEQT